MCIFSGDVEEVNNTKIFISVVHPAKLVVKEKKGYKMPVGKPLQLVIYSNAVQNNDNIAMILPFPLISGTNRVKILDMSKYSGFFEDIDMMLPNISTNSVRPRSGDYFDSEESLEVQYVGNYKASIVPSFSSFDKLQYNEFNLKPDVKELLRKYYSNKFGFMVCIINNKSLKKSQFHPFAYVHEIRNDNRIFVPTRHYHKKYVKSYYSKYHEISGISSAVENDDVSDYLYNTLMIDDKWMKLSSKKQDLQTYRDKEENDWDHEIYVVNISRLLKNPLFAKPGIRIISADVKKLINFYTYIESSKLPKEIVLTKPIALHKITIDENYKNNHDLYL